MKLNYLKTIFNILFLTLPLFMFVGCDEDGNPLPSGYKMEFWKDNIKYLDEVPLLLPPGGKSGPELQFYLAPGSQTERNLSLYSSPYKTGNPKTPSFRIYLHYPMDNGIEINKKYTVKSIAGNEIVVKGESDFNDFESGEAFLRYNEEYNKTHYGTGFIVFTKYERTENGTTVLEGSIDFTIPNETGDDSVLKGTFKLPLYHFD